MNVLLIHQAFVSPDQAGGTRHFEFARHCWQAGVRMTIVASNLNYLTGRRVDGARGIVAEQDCEGVRVLRAWTYPALHRSFTWRVVSFLSFMLSSVWAGLRAGPVDVVMGTSPPIFQAVSAWIVAFIRRRPLLLEIRDLWPEFAIDMGILRNPVLIRLSRWLERFLYARATHLLVNSPAYRDYLLKKGIPEHRITLIPNGVDPAMFDPNATGASVRDEFGLQGRFVVVYTGALGVANDLTTLLKAAALVQDDPRIKVLIVGDGKERPQLEAMAAALRINNVVFTGARPKSQMREFLAASDACLAILQNIPMFTTTYPNKVFDYMAAGRPTILAIDGVIREVIERAGGGIVVSPGREDLLAAAIRQLRAEPARARAMGAGARTYVCKEFNRSQHAAQFVTLLTRVGAPPV